MAGEQTPGNTPAATPPVSPTGGEQTPSQPSKEESVTLSKKEHDELQRKAAQTDTAMRDKDILENKLKKYERPGRKVAETQAFESNEVSEVKRIITSKVLTTADYQKLTQGNPELARILTKNPLDLLDVNEFVDVDDAVNQVLDYLDDRVKASGSGSGQPSPATPPPPATPPAPQPGGGANPSPEALATDEKAKQEKEFEKLPPMERIKAKIASRVNVK